MKRQDITLGNINYIVDLYDAYEDMSSTPHYEKFYMIRNGIFENGLFETSDIMFIQQSLVKETNLIDELSKTVVFPITGKDAKISYSKTFTDFSQFFNERTFKPGNNLERIYKNDLENEASIICDKIRIWIPTVNPTLNAIIDVEVFINDIRMHLVCKRSDSFEIDSNSEFTYDHNTYSEYFDIYVPNVSNLFKKNNYYFKEVFNMTNFKKRKVLTFVDSTLKDITHKSIKNKTLLENEVLTIDQEYYVDQEHDGEDYAVKCKITTIGNNAKTSSKYTVNVNVEHDDDPNTVISNVINISDVENLNTIDIYDENNSKIYSIEPDTNEIKVHDEDIFLSMHTIVLPSFVDNGSSAKVYDEHINQLNSIAIYSKTYYDDSSISSYISVPIKVILYPYSTTNVSDGIYLLSENANFNLDTFSKDKHIVMQVSYEFVKDEQDKPETQKIKHALVIHAEYEYSNEYESLNEAYLDMVNEEYTSYVSEDIDIDIDDEIIPEEIKTCGYVVEIATDINFTSVIYSSIVNIDIPNDDKIVIDDLDFVISMNNINATWSSYPDFLVARVRYFDKLTATIIDGNIIMITKEEFKYIVNNSGRRLSIKNDPNNDMYFIDKINCTIVRNDEPVEKSIQSGKGSSKILYRPIFYKAKDLDQIKIKSGLTQNIGLNLSSLLSKVDTFKIQINGKEYVEIGRNDQYVIFKINALELSDSTGQYNLLNQNDEYISDGTWYVY